MLTYLDYIFKLLIMFKEKKEESLSEKANDAGCEKAALHAGYENKNITYEIIEEIQQIFYYDLFNPNMSIYLSNDMITIIIEYLTQKSLDLVKIIKKIILYWSNIEFINNSSYKQHEYLTNHLLDFFII